MVDLGDRLAGNTSVGRSDKTHLVGQDDCGKSVTDPELGVDVLEVLVDRPG